MIAGVAEGRDFKGLSLVGGHLILDMLNSVKYRGRSDPKDRLCSLDDVIDWAELVLLVDSYEAGVLRGLAREKSENSETVFRDILAFRENLRCVLEPNRADKDSTASQKRTPTKLEAAKLEAAIALEKVIETLRPSAQINLSTGTLKRDFPIHALVDLKYRLVQSAVELMEMVPKPYLKCCDADDCDWLFIDRSKAKRRRWCDTATCGNRARVRQFRAQEAG